MRRILHVDMDAFFAAIEQARRAELRGKPVIVGGHGDPTQRGVVSTASYEARRFGIHSGMPLRRAYALCPHGVYLPVDFAAYAQISGRFKSLLKEFSPLVEDSGVDEAFLDISDRSERSKDIALAIKRRIKSATGLTCSVGIGPNKLLAKLASDMQKPDGLTILRKADIPGRVWPLPTRKLIGIGPKTEKRLAAMGVQTIGKLANVPLARLQRQFGPAHGRYLHDAAHGIDESPLVTEWQPKSMSREITFQHDVDESGVITQALDELAGAAVGAAQAECLRARTVTVKVRFADFETLTRQTMLARPSNALKTIEEAARHCLGRVPLVKKVRLIGMRLSGLTRKQAARERQHYPTSSDRK